jgi:hypothetical protein
MAIAGDNTTGPFSPYPKVFGQSIPSTVNASSSGIDKPVDDGTTQTIVISDDVEMASFIVFTRDEELHNKVLSTLLLWVVILLTHFPNISLGFAIPSLGVFLRSFHRLSRAHGLASSLCQDSVRL